MSPNKEKSYNNFLAKMVKKHKLSRPTIVDIFRRLKFADYDPKREKEYDQSLVKYAKFSAHIRTSLGMMKLPENRCPIPKCEGYRISMSPRNGGGWICSTGGEHHYVSWRIAEINLVKHKIEITQENVAKKALELVEAKVDQKKKTE